MNKSRELLVRCLPHITAMRNEAAAQLVGEIVDHLKASPDEAERQWRDPKDKPPHLPGEHHSEDVLLLMKDLTEPGGRAYRLGHVSLGHWRPNGGNGNFDDDVQAWMPLPSAPEGKG